MTNERYEYLSGWQPLDLPLTEDEFKEGWHYCMEFDGLLVKGDPNEPLCGKACIDWKGNL
jgi:hypothetical protein